MEAAFQRHQRRAAPRYAAGAGRLIAAAVGEPDGILIGAGKLPGHLIAAGRLLRADRRPGSELPRRNRRAAIPQFRPGPSADAIKEKVRAHFDQAGRPERLDRRRRNHRSDGAVAVQILMEAAFQRHQRRAAPRYAAGAGRLIAAAVGEPDRILIGAGKLPGHLVAAGRLLRADRRPGSELPRRSRRAAIFELGAGAGAIAVEIEI